MGASDEASVEIRDGSIRLGQFLKLADLVQDGVEAKARIQAGEVLVNDEVETRRGRQLVPGDRVSVMGRTVGIVARDH